MNRRHEWATPGYEEEVKRWSQIVRKFRKAIGWTQGELARQIGVTYFSVNKYENERALPVRLVREGIKELLRKTFKGIEPADVIDMDELELQKFFIKEAEKRLRKPEIIIRRRSIEMGKQEPKSIKKTE